LRYLADSRKVADHWYPKDLHKRAQIDQYLDWHHNFLRQGCAGYLYRKNMAPLLGKTYTTEELDVFLQLTIRSIKQLEQWLTTNAYLCGSEISIADLSASQELFQTIFMNLDLKPYPKVEAWLNKIMEGTQEMKEVNAPVKKMAENFHKKQASQSPKL